MECRRYRLPQTPMTVAFVHNQALPYRHFLFAALAEQFDIDWFFFNQQAGDIPPSLNATLLRGYHIPKASDYWVVPGLRRALRRKHYDLIVGGDLGAYNTAVAHGVAKAAGIPFIPWIIEWNEILHPRRWLRRRFENQLIQHAAALITPGIRHQEYLLRRGAQPQQIVRIPNIVEFSARQLDGAHPLVHRLLAYQAEAPLVVSIGRHVAFKGHAQLIRAQALLEAGDVNNAPHTVIAGDGPLLEANRRLAAQLGVQRLHFIAEFVGEATKHVLYHLADIFTLTSTRIRAFEPWGLVCNEALAYGKPMVVSDAVGATGEVVRDGENGLIFADGHPRQLADALARLLADAALRERFAAGSRALQAAYGPTLMVERFAKLLRRFQP